MFAFERDGPENGRLHFSPQIGECGILDHLLARGQNELERGRVDDVDPDRPFPPCVDFPDGGHAAGNLDAMKIDARIARDVIGIAEDSDPAAMPLFDPAGALEEILARQDCALKFDGQREMLRRCFDPRLEIGQPFGGHGNDELCAFADLVGFDR